jgi:hypothetical protein
MYLPTLTLYYRIGIYLFISFQQLPAVFREFNTIVYDRQSMVLKNIATRTLNHNALRTENTNSDVKKKKLQ